MLKPSQHFPLGALKAPSDKPSPAKHVIPGNEGPLGPGDQLNITHPALTLSPTKVFHTYQELISVQQCP